MQNTYYSIHHDHSNELLFYQQNKILLSVTMKLTSNLLVKY